jgi:plasmid stabilization system protein ParE
MHKEKFTLEALDELRSSALYLDAPDIRLGLEFMDEFDDAVNMILKHPLAWTCYDDGVRYFYMTRFKHKVYYRILDDMIIEIIAIRHSRQRPL